MKKIVVFLILFGLIGSSIYMYFNMDTETKNKFLKSFSREEAKEENKSEIKDEEHKVINGLFVSNNDNIVTFINKDRVYSVTLKDKTIDYKYGEFIKIAYEGDFDSNKEKQNLEVFNISSGDKNSYKDVLSDDGLFKDCYDKAYNKLKRMSLDEKIGQLLIVRVPDIKAITAVKKYQFGGYILFGRDTKGKTKEEIIDMIKSWNNVSKIPLLIATDEEGGIVARVSSNENLRTSRFLSPQNVYKSGGFAKIKEDNIEKNKLLYSLGINVNLAPVADISLDEKDYIYSRSFGKGPKETSEFIKTIVNSSKGTNVSNTLKHFPGYGNNVDTHTGISIDKRSLDEFRKRDFLPFKAGIEAGVESILVSHNIIVNVENNVPASLSFNIHKILRNELKFDGIIMTDDLEMDAIGKYVKKSSLEALKSGNDLIMVSDYSSSIQEIKKALDDKTISENLIDRAVIRVLAWKYYKNML